jgi:DNA-binding beta-propeller fold protein YncE
MLGEASQALVKETEVPPLAMAASVVHSEILRNYDILVSSAAAASGVVRDGVFRFDPETGQFRGYFGHGVEIRDPRGIRLSPDGEYVVVNNGDDRILKFDAKTGFLVNALPSIQGLNPGGGKFGWDGRYYVGSRTLKSVIAFDLSGRRDPSTFVAPSLVAFPRGIATSSTKDTYVASGTNPVTGEGRNTILRFDPLGRFDDSFHVEDAELSPLDIEIGPNGNVFAASEFPFGHPRALTTVREYDHKVGGLLRVFDAGVDASTGRITRMPRGITFGPDGELYSAGADNVVRYNFADGRFDRIVLESPDILIQSIIFIPKGNTEVQLPNSWVP